MSDHSIGKAHTRIEPSLASQGTNFHHAAPSSSAFVRWRMAGEYEEEKTNRRGCFLVIAGVVVALALLAAFGFGLFGNVEGGKITDLPVAGSGNSL